MVKGVEMAASLFAKFREEIHGHHARLRNAYFEEWVHRLRFLVLKKRTNRLEIYGNGLHDTQ